MLNGAVRIFILLQVVSEFWLNIRPRAERKINANYKYMQQITQNKHIQSKKKTQTKQERYNPSTQIKH